MIGWLLLGLVILYDIYALTTDRVETISAALCRRYSDKPEWLRAVIFWLFVALWGMGVF